MNWIELGVIVGVLSPLVGVPLVAITLYLRAIRDHQTSTMREMTHRIEVMESSIRDLLRSTADFEREYATKEEWVREAMLARQSRERLTELVVRIQAELENTEHMAVEIGRLAAAMMELAQRLPKPTEASITQE